MQIGQPGRLDNDGVRRIAVICFLPDVGHVLPLLRLAHLVTKHCAARVTCYLAPQFEKLALECGFDFHGLRSLEGTEKPKVFMHLSRKTNFYNAFSGFAVLADNYWAPIAQGISCELGTVAARLNMGRPEFVIADDHVFSDYYKMIAQAFGARLLLHRSNGSLLPYQRPYVYAYGLNTQPSWVQSLVEFAGRLNRKTVRRWRRLSIPGQVRDAETARISLRKAADDIFGGVPKTMARDPIRVACGTCVLEEIDRTVVDIQEQSREIFLPPLRAPTTEPLPAELAAWISKQSRTIVYISFGTLLCPERPLLRSLARGLKAAGVAAFWALPAAQRNWLASENLHAEQFFLQTSCRRRHYSRQAA